MAIPKCFLTKKGAALLAKTPEGNPVPVTRWQIGKGPLPASQNVEDMTQLLDPIKYIPISAVTNSNQQSLVLGQFVNEGMPSFQWEELGLWATDPDEGEILYAVGNARGSGDVIESWSEKVREFIFGMELVFSGTANVTAEISKTLVFATLADLEHKADLDPETGKVQADQLPEVDLSGKADLVDGKVPSAQLPPMGAWYRVFEAEQWESGVLRIPKSEHGMTPSRKECMFQLRQRVDRTALDYYGSAASQGRTGIVNAMKAALAANTEASGTYPTAPDGHVQLTWAQVQYYLLEQVLATDEEASAQAAAKGFAWQDRDITGAPQTVTLDEVLAAAYVPALDGSSSTLDALCTAEVLQGLRLRRKADRVTSVDQYDLDGSMVRMGWAALESLVYWDLGTQDLVISGDTPFAGDIMVMS